MPYIIYHPNGEITMPDELPQSPPESDIHIESLPEEQEETEDIEGELEHAFAELYGRLDASERENAELRQRLTEHCGDGHEHRATGEENTSPSQQGGDSGKQESDVHPRASHFYFREIRHKE